ncbi:MAG: hypothetical protein ABSB35_28130 [Bryobacteraceae bacterium]|jgi:hypothetical protein
MDVNGKVLGWAQTSLGQGEDDTGRLIHMIHWESANVIYKAPLFCGASRRTQSNSGSPCAIY